MTCILCQFRICPFQVENPTTKPERKLGQSVRIALNPSGVFPNVPWAFCKWLLDEKGVSNATKGLYKHCVGNFLGYVANKYANQETSLYYAWDVNLVTSFFKILQTVVLPSSIVNYCSALASVRSFMRLNGNRPADFADIQNRFELLSTKISRNRRSYVAEAKAASIKEHGVLRRFYLQVYHSVTYWKRYRAIVRAARNGKKLTPADLTFVNGLMIAATSPTNFPRSGNIGLLEANTAFAALETALTNFKTLHPQKKIFGAPRRLDREFCSPAVLPIGICSKTLTRQDLVLLRPRDVQALLNYHQIIRPNAPMEVKTDKFFFNSLGDSLNKDIWYYLRAICKPVGLPDITMGTLRRAIETENSLKESDAVSSHLNHTGKTADVYYIIRDPRHSVKAASDLLRIVEDLGEQKISEPKVSSVNEG